MCKSITLKWGDRLFFTAESIEFTVWCDDFNVYIGEISRSFVSKVLYIGPLVLYTHGQYFDHPRRQRNGQCSFFVRSFRLKFDIFLFLITKRTVKSILTLCMTLKNHNWSQKTYFESKYICIICFFILKTGTFLFFIKFWYW